MFRNLFRKNNNSNKKITNEKNVYEKINSKEVKLKSCILKIVSYGVKSKFIKKTEYYKLILKNKVNEIIFKKNNVYKFDYKDISIESNEKTKRFLILLINNDVYIYNMEFDKIKTTNEKWDDFIVSYDNKKIVGKYKETISFYKIEYKNSIIKLYKNQKKVHGNYDLLDFRSSIVRLIDNNLSTNIEKKLKLYHFDGVNLIDKKIYEITILE